MFSIWQLSVVFFLNLVAIRVFAYCATRLGILIDSPNDRSAHRHPTVRGAGVIFVISALLFWTFIGNRSNSGFLPGLILGGSVIAAISFIDDVRSLSAGIRLAVHAIAALIFISSIPLPLFYGVDPRIIALLWWPMATVFLVGVSNIYNFMDGIDGMSSLHSILVLLGWITLFGVPHRADVLVSLGLLVPLIAFLTLNWFPAKVFMGDVGSIFIGYSIGCLALLQAPNFSS
ncbi:hypothetical protein KDA11_03255, partial [Candidatus Saccharibacteria bacterium]|nr:hypothetical protein [Candidatus Saccharibacteria bacterium]